jgi:hypothetical protein
MTCDGHPQDSPGNAVNKRVGSDGPPRPMTKCEIHPEAPNGLDVNFHVRYFSGGTALDLKTRREEGAGVWKEEGAGVWKGDRVEVVDS